jgi:hypothetical protein
MCPLTFREVVNCPPWRMVLGCSASALSEPWTCRVWVMAAVGRTNETVLTKDINWTEDKRKLIAPTLAPSLLDNQVLLQASRA